MSEIEAFAAHWRLLGQSEHTIECYLGVLRRFAQRTAIETATPLDLRAYLTERSLTVSAATSLLTCGRCGRSTAGARRCWSATTRAAR